MLQSVITSLLRGNRPDGFIWSLCSALPAVYGGLPNELWIIVRSGYWAISGPPDIAHARRRLVALQDMDCRVAYPLKLIARLYRIEHLADARGLAPDDRAALRRERSAPVLEQLHRWCGLTRAQEPPSTDLAKAAGYVVNHGPALSRFLDDGRIDLDNNLCESQLRDIAVGRN